MSASTNHSPPKRVRFEPTALPTANTPSAAAIAAFVSGGSMLQRLTPQLVTDNAKEFVSLINLLRSKEKALSKFKDGFIPSSVKTNTALKGTPNVTKSTHFKDIQDAMTIIANTYCLGMTACMQKCAELEVENCKLQLMIFTAKFTNKVVKTYFLLHKGPEDPDQVDAVTHLVLKDVVVEPLLFGRSQEAILSVVPLGALPLPPLTEAGGGTFHNLATVAVTRSITTMLVASLDAYHNKIADDQLTRNANELFLEEDLSEVANQMITASDDIEIPMSTDLVTQITKLAEKKATFIFEKKCKQLLKDAGGAKNSSLSSKRSLKGKKGKEKKLGRNTASAEQSGTTDLKNSNSNSRKGTERKGKKGKSK